MRRSFYSYRRLRQIEKHTERAAKASEQMAAGQAEANAILCGIWILVGGLSLMIKALLVVFAILSIWMIGHRLRVWQGIGWIWDNVFTVRNYAWAMGIGCIILIALRVFHVRY